MKRESNFGQFHFGESNGIGFSAHGFTCGKSLVRDG